jgi:hypothetical protein
MALFSINIHDHSIHGSIRLANNEVYTIKKCGSNCHKVGLFLVTTWHNVDTRETREGRPLLTVETEANGHSKSTNPSFVGSL